MIRRLIILLFIVGCVFAESKSTIITNKGNTVEYVFRSYKPQQDRCLSTENREKIQRQLNENILRLNIDQQLLRANEHALFEWPLSLNDESNDYGYHGVSGFVDNNLNYNNNLLDYNCGNRTYDTEDYNHQGTDYFLWPFNWDKVENDVVSVVAASSGIIVGKSDGNYDKNCGGWDTDYSTEWNAVYVQNDDGSISWYGHMKNGSLTNKSFGDTVKVGEYLGIVASSGISTGPHLHFETYKDNTYTHLIDPYYGDCNNHNTDSWWIAQRPYYDSAINKIMTHSAPPEFYWNECAKPANINAENNFTPNNYIYFGAYYRDQLSDQVSQFSLIDPEGNIYDAWEQTLEDVDHYSASYWWYSYLFNNTVIKGEWTFQIIYNEKQYEHKFLICDNDILPDDACDCNGYIEDECGVCGGEAGFDECAVVNPDLVGAWIISTEVFEECENLILNIGPDYINYMDDGTAFIRFNLDDDQGCSVDDDCSPPEDQSYSGPVSAEFTCNQNINNCQMSNSIEWGYIYNTEQLCTSIPVIVDDIESKITFCDGPIIFNQDGTWFVEDDCQISNIVMAIEGCTNANACNTDEDANWDDGISCRYSEDECGVCGGDNSTCTGCLYQSACNYDVNAIIDDGSCIFSEENYDCDGNCLILEDTDENGECDGQLSIDENIIPAHYSISSIYPNPFNPVTSITYGLPENTDIQVTVYDLMGTQITILENTFQTAGYHTISWNASSYPSGVYLIRMDSGDFTQTQKVVLIK